MIIIVYYLRLPKIRHWSIDDRMMAYSSLVYFFPKQTYLYLFAYTTNNTNKSARCLLLTSQRSSISSIRAIGWNSQCIAMAIRGPPFSLNAGMPGIFHKTSSSSRREEFSLPPTMGRVPKGVGVRQWRTTQVWRFFFFRFFLDFIGLRLQRREKQRAVCCELCDTSNLLKGVVKGMMYINTHTHTKMIGWWTMMNIQNICLLLWRKKITTL